MKYTACSHLLLVAVLTLTSLQAGETPPTTSPDLKNLPDLKANPTDQQTRIPVPKAALAPNTSVPDLILPESKAKQEARNKDLNWAVEGLKEKRETERIALEKENDSIDDLLQKERKLLNDATDKPSGSPNQFKPSIESNWHENLPANSSSKEKIDKQSDLQQLGQLQTGLSSNIKNYSLNDKERLDSPQAFDSNIANEANQAAKNYTFKPLNDAPNQFDKPQSKTSNNFDSLVSTGQAQSYQKLSNDPDFQVINANTGQRNSINSVPGIPSVPTPVTSTLTLETMRQMETQRINAIPRPNMKELNSRIADPAGPRRF
jgi:hypothetical protein